MRNIELLVTNILVHNGFKFKARNGGRFVQILDDKSIRTATITDECVNEQITPVHGEPYVVGHWPLKQYIALNRRIALRLIEELVTQGIGTHSDLIAECGLERKLFFPYVYVNTGEMIPIVDAVMQEAEYQRAV